MFGEVEDKDVEFNRAKLMQCKSYLNALNIIQCSHYLEFNMQKVLNSKQIMTNWMIPAFISIEVQVYESRISVSGLCCYLVTSVCFWFKDQV